jgi:hypothetical protein
MNSEPIPPRRRSWAKPLTVGAVAFVAIWLVMAYLVLPQIWSEYESHLAFGDDDPRITQTADHHPGDPLNVALVGTEEQLVAMMREADWFPAAALGLKSDLKIAADTVLARPDPTAPVSSLFLFGRKEDVAFEQPVGDSPRRRHHVRFWKSDELGNGGRPVWIGSAVFDEGVGLSRTTGQITHVTAADVDRERDYLFSCLEKTGRLSEHYDEPGFHTTRQGRNGGGDLWQTDGALSVGIISNGDE